MPENIFSCIFWAVLSTGISIQLIKKEDKKYALSPALQIVSYIVSVAFAVAFSCFYPNVSTIATISIVGAIGSLCPSMIIDFKFQELPNIATGVALVFSLLSYVFLYQNNLLTYWNFLSVVIGFVALILMLMTGNLGGGDVKMAVPLMIVLQCVKPIALLNAFAYSLITAIVYVAGSILYNSFFKKKKDEPKTESSDEVIESEKTENNIESTETMVNDVKNGKHLFAFGPFLIIGTMLAYFIALI